MDKIDVFLLLSGGIDSTACATYYLKQNFSVTALFVDYGQVSAENEKLAAVDICRYFNIPLDVIVCKGFGKKFLNGYIPGRNAFLLFTALMAVKQKTGLVGIGIHSGTRYYDCSEQFVQNIQPIYDAYTDGCVVIDVPFLRWNKRQIWDYCIKEKVPVELTYSCELGLTQPCGQCPSCKDLEVLYAG